MNDVTIEVAPDPEETEGPATTVAEVDAAQAAASAEEATVAAEAAIALAETQAAQVTAIAAAEIAETKTDMQLAQERIQICETALTGLATVIPELQAQMVEMRTDWEALKQSILSPSVSEVQEPTVEVTIPETVPHPEGDAGASQEARTRARRRFL